MSKTPKQSAGLLMYRKNVGIIEFFLVHPGGPYWSKKNEGYRTIPKSEYDANEKPLAAAIREFQEETGFKVSEPFIELGSVTQETGKIAYGRFSVIPVKFFQHADRADTAAIRLSQPR